MLEVEKLNSGLDHGKEGSFTLKEIIAVIRPGKWPATAAKLNEMGVMAYTRHRVYGRGKQKGLRYGGSEGGKMEGGISLLPKWMIHLIVESSRVDGIVRVLMEANRTGEIGDGKIFICPVREAVRIRTNETESYALN